MNSLFESTADGRASRRGSRAIDKSDIKAPVLLVLVILTISSAILFGGSPNIPGWKLSVILILSCLVAVFAVLQDGLSELRRLGFLPKLFLVLLLALPLIQVIPLPPSIWMQFPGRDVQQQVFELIGADNQWHSISLNPTETLFVLVCLFPPAAIFLAALKFNSTELRLVIIAVVLLALISTIVGLFQFSTNGGVFNFYNSSHKRFLVGFFANRNHQGLFIAISLALAINLVFQFSKSRAMALSVSGLVAFFCVGVTVATASRAGFFLAILSAILAVLANTGAGIKPRRSISILLLAGVAFFLLFQSIGLVFENVIERYSTISEDLRWEFWEQSAMIIAHYFPVGTGLGTFVPIYQQFEPLEAIVPVYANHVHNDYYELVLETGIGGVIVLASLIAALLQAGLQMRLSAPSKTRIVSFVILILCLLHSVVDYPLRTQAIAVLFALCLAIIVKRPAR
ncbi:O-antigen ligase family protein [Parasphingorhabdus sp.]|uniref:O-antigen ligase family protein n=1 Tax=Parasphingorhabdus sp. TaxID=2709688 RepID=UPI003D2B2952